MKLLDTAVLVDIDKGRDEYKRATTELEKIISRFDVIPADRSVAVQARR